MYDFLDLGRYFGVTFVFVTQQRDGSPAVMAVGVIEGTSEAIFRTLMCLGQSRIE